MQGNDGEIMSPRFNLLQVHGRSFAALEGRSTGKMFLNDLNTN